MSSQPQGSETSASTGYQAQATPQAQAGGNPLDQLSPEKAVAAAFAGGFVVARLLKKLRG